jgi:hypothetical protein
MCMHVLGLGRASCVGLLASTCADLLASTCEWGQVSVSVCLLVRGFGFWL